MGSGFDWVGAGLGSGTGLTITITTDIMGSFTTTKSDNNKRVEYIEGSDEFDAFMPVVPAAPPPEKVYEGVYMILN